MGRGIKEENPNNLTKITYLKKCEFYDKCIGKMYNNDLYYYYGKGNLNAYTMFIIPPHETNKVPPVEKALNETFTELFNIDICKSCYITRSIKCPVKEKDKLEETFKKCSTHLYNEMYIVAPRVVIIIGMDNSYISDIFQPIFPKIKFITVPNPLTKTINTSAYNKLKEILKKYVIL